MATSDVELQIEDRIGRTVLQELRDDNEKARDLGNGGLPLIFIFPSVFRDLSPKCFQPRMVSIGPLHKQDKHLNEFEVKKTSYVHRFLYSLGTTPDQMLEDCAVGTEYLDRNHDHILGLLHKHFHPVNNIRSGDYTNPKRHSALELDSAGVSFMPYEDDN
ncbi:unnamed protein product [Lactuca saligna]|uniref:Uncharacterized protein n=1 Tax=Lactuca saligna TaxID=75948 RepID=A0AA35VVZ5_LACSI|nr:unnamed protein product [Lactuca saligna]